MRVLRLDDPAIKYLRHSHPRLRGMKVLARGTFGAVLTTDNPDRVLKLTVDSIHYGYLVDGCSPQGGFKPRVTEDFDEIGEDSQGRSVYLVEMERLECLRRGTDNYRLAHKLSTVRMARGDRLARILEEWELPKELRHFVTDLDVFVHNMGGRTDYHGSNFMQRPQDKSLVFSDPVCDYAMLERERRVEDPKYGIWH